MSEPNEVVAALSQLKLGATALIAAIESPQATPAMITAALNTLGMGQQKWAQALQTVPIVKMLKPDEPTESPAES